MIQVRGDDKDDPTTYLVTFDKEEGAKYLVIGFVYSVLQLVSENDSFHISVTYAFIYFFQPLPTKLVLQKKKAKEGRSGDEIEHFPVPSRITVSKTAHGGTMERGESSGLHVWFSLLYYSS
jgi:RNA polymerase II-associated factor 1